MPGIVIRRKEMCGVRGGPSGAKCERRKGHDGSHMGSPKRNGKRIATDVVEWK